MITAVHKDLDACTMVITAEFDATAEQVWDLWADPRKLERWWGPPAYPATFVDHSLTAGGRMTYFMTGPAGDQHHGAWTVVAVEPPRHLAVEDAFAEASGEVDTSLPVTMMHVRISELAERRTAMAIESTFASAEGMARVIEMGMEEGMTSAMSQIDAILASADV